MFAYIPWVLISLGLRTPCVSFCPHSHLFVHCPHYIPLPLMSGPRVSYEPLWLDILLLETGRATGFTSLFFLLQPFSHSGLPSLSPVDINPRFLFLSGFHLASPQRSIFGSTSAPYCQPKAIGSPALATIPKARPQLS